MIGMIATGGYGGHSYDSVADIDWSKDSKEINFGSISQEIKFTVESKEIQVFALPNSFNIEINSFSNFIDIKTEQINFVARS